MSQKVLIVGGLGYLGSTLAPFLRQKGLDTTIMDAGFFADCRIDKKPCEDYIEKDARDIEAEDLKPYDVIVQFAGISNDPVGGLSQETVYDPTRQYAKDIAQICKKLGKKFIFASSCSGYGIGGNETLDETSVCRPQTPYSLNKMQIEEDLVTLADGTFAPVALRFATVFGYSPRLRLDVFANMMCAMAVSQGDITLNSDGQAWRPSLHILDLCEAVYRTVLHKGTPGQLLVLNVGQESLNHQILDVANTIASCKAGATVSFLHQKDAGSQSEVIKDRKIKDGKDTRTYKVSFEKIRKVFPGFICQYSLKDGVQDLINKLEDLNFDQQEFENINYYRLQKFESLWDQGLITGDMAWKVVPVKGAQPPVQSNRV